MQEKFRGSILVVVGGVAAVVGLSVDVVAVVANADSFKTFFRFSCSNRQLQKQTLETLVLFAAN